jgi:hypothetical protein
LDFGTDAHAPVTVDAPRHVDGDVRVGAILSIEGRSALGRSVYQPGATNLFVKRLVGKQPDRARWIVTDEHLKDSAPRLLNLRRVGLDLHAVRQWRGARGDELG